MKMPHTGTHRGKRVRVVLRNGTVIIARFYERNDRTVFLKDERGKMLSIPKSSIKAFGDDKPGKHP